MNPLFFELLVVILLFNSVFVCCWVWVVKERISRRAEFIDRIADQAHKDSARLDDMETNLPKVKLMELQELFGALKSEFDGVLVENDAFRQKCTNQMQRFDSIMRRTKALVTKGGKVTIGDGEVTTDADDEEDGPLPQRFLAENPGALGAAMEPRQTTGGALRDERRTAMRKKWKENRGL